MKIKKAYNLWASTYDGNENKTRDLELLAAKAILTSSSYGHILELGCGTGKNTLWLKDKADSLIALDFSEEMLAVARSKISSDKILFSFADLNKEWNVEDGYFDLISCSLTLEHISNIDFIFNEANKKLKAQGIFYICELHPFKQYTGSKAKFGKEKEEIVLDVFIQQYDRVY